MTQVPATLSAPDTLTCYVPPAPGNSRIEDQLRRFSAHATHWIAKRYGQHIGIWVGCGYPKSGTVWLCQLMSSVLDLPYTQNYLLPVAMSSVVHAHWSYDKRLPNSIYIVRDGRDVMVSFYHYRMKALDSHRSPRHAKKIGKVLKHRFGKNFDPMDIDANLPGFIELELQGKFSPVAGWADHVRQWTCPRPNNVGVLRYEDLLLDPAETLGNAFEQVLGVKFDPWVLETAVKRFDFGRRSGRTRGVEDSNSFLRKGVAGDWKSSFNREAAETFNHYAGDMLVEAGYEKDLDWFE